ncbi:MAG: hypothetical protein ACR2GR_10555 [Rhodothermales bacterium]
MQKKMQAPELDKEAYEQFIAFERIGGRAVRKAQEESRRLGVPNVYEIGGVIYYEHPDGTLSTRDTYDEWQALRRKEAGDGSGM